MTPVQASTLPYLLEGKDVLAQAKTGSGKTAAFAISILNRLDVSHLYCQALILCPTRELADQVTAEVRRLASALSNTRVLTLCGGKPIQAQLASLKHDAHVIVGTPGRIQKHLTKGSLTLDRIQTVVLDEADRMLDMGFQEDILAILDKTNPARQTLLFSATYADSIRGISRAIQNQPREVRVETTHRNEQIQQLFYTTTDADKKNTLFKVLNEFQPESSIVFCNRKVTCQDIADALVKHGFSAKALHGDLDQFERDQALIQFANRSLSILVATDVAARGLDIKELGAVINLDLSPDPETHVHRIGRTGRAGNEGLAISLMLPDEQFRASAIEHFQDSPVTFRASASLGRSTKGSLVPPTTTLHINAGRKDKVRPGDIVGALTATSELTNDHIGKITVLDKQAYVAVLREITDKALNILRDGKMKGRKFRVKALS